MKLLRNLKRYRIKRKAKILKSIINEFRLELYFRDSLQNLASLNEDDDFRHIFQHKNHLDGQIVFILNTLQKVFEDQKADCCIDVGGNIGLVSLYLSKISKNVFVFEPEPKNQIRLKRHMDVNGCQNITLIPKAVSDSSGQSSLYLSPAAGHHSLGLAHPSLHINKRIIVEKISLDEFVKQQKLSTIQILKVDVEGFEEEVFLGARDLLSKGAIEIIVFEISWGVLDRLKRSWTPLFQILNQYDYHIYSHTGALLNQEKCPDQDIIAMKQKTFHRVFHQTQSLIS